MPGCQLQARLRFRHRQPTERSSSLLPETDVTGWFDTGTTPHYRDANLQAGTFQGKTLASIMQFNLHNLPTDSKVLFAAVELTGLDASHLGTDGTWQLEFAKIV